MPDLIAALKSGDTTAEGGNPRPARRKKSKFRKRGDDDDSGSEAGSDAEGAFCAQSRVPIISSPRLCFLIGSASSPTHTRVRSLFLLF